MTHTSVKPVRLKLHSEPLGCDVLRGIGHRGNCECGWTGPVRTARSVAREDERIHRASCER